MIEKPVAGIESNSGEPRKELFEALGIAESPDDQAVVESAIGILTSEIADSPKIGRSIENKKTHRKELVIPIIAAEQRERILEALYELGVYPWEEDGILIVDNKRELEKLELAGVIKGAFPGDEGTSRATSTAERFEDTRFAYPLPKREIEPASPRRKSEDVPMTDSQDEPGIDTELEDIVRRFDAGILEDESEAERSSARMPTLTLFPDKYVWKNKQLMHAHTGEIVTQEAQAELRKKAREGDARAIQEVIRMHIGLVISLAKRIQARFGGDIDEIFQGGLLGLESAIRNNNIEKYEGRFTSYAAKSIEGGARSELQASRGVIHRPAHTSSERKVAWELEHEEQKARQALGPRYKADESERAYKIERLMRFHLMGAKFDPIEDHFDDEAWKQVDNLGHDMSQAPTQESSVQYAEIRNKVFEILSQLSPRERFIVAAKNGLFEPFMAPEELEPFISKRGIELNEEGNVLNPTDLEPIDWFALYVSNRLPVKPDLDIEEGFSLEEIGILLGVTGGRISQIEAKALRHMKHPAQSRKLYSHFSSLDLRTDAAGIEASGSDYRPPEEMSNDIEKIRANLNPERFGASEGWKRGPDIRTELGNMSQVDFNAYISRLAKTNPEWIQQRTNPRGMIERYYHPEVLVELKKRVDSENEPE